MPVPEEKGAALVAEVDQGSNIWVAAADGDMKRVQFLLEHGGVTPTSKDSVEYTPIHAAASYAKHEVLRFLLKDEKRESADVEDNDGDTPLFFCDDVATAKILVDEFHADAKHKNHDGKTAAENALINGSDDLAAYLSSITGETLESRSALLARYGEEDDEDEGGQQEAIEGRLEEIEEDPETEERVNEMMERVEAIMKHAEETGTDPSEKLRELVGASIMRQIMEGYDK